MPKVFGKPSQYLREKSLHHLYKSVLMASGGLTTMFVLLQAQSFYSNKMVGFIVTYSLIVFVAVLAYKFSQEDDRVSDSYYSGREGERIIFEELKKLPDEFRVFCDVKIDPPYNIDFVVLGPTGIFTVEVKSHTGKIAYENGKITVNGFAPKEKDFLKQAKSEAGAIAGYLKKMIEKDVWASPVLVFSSPKASIRFGLNPVEGVFVVQKGFLLPLLNTQKQRCSEDVLLGIEEALIKI